MLIRQIDFEEPLDPDRVDDYAELRRVSPVPLAGGEVLTRRQSFESWFRANALPHTDLVEYRPGSPYIDELTVDGFTLDAERGPSHNGSSGAGAPARP